MQACARWSSPARCRRRCWPSPSGTSVRTPASWSPPRTTRRRTTATRSTSATARRSSRRPTPRSRPRSTRSGRWRPCPAATSWDTLGDEVLEAYLDRVASLVDPASPRDLAIVYTPLHGVGRDVVLAAFDRAGFAAPTVVARQADPDPDFSTVSFPNPEEPGAIDLALEAAAQHGADIVLANDPDADRCAVAVPDGSGWRMLRGDEVGALLAAHLVRREPTLQGTFAESIVSSSLLGRIAEAHGLGYAETLTGFKWISRVEGLRYGYEEALGYCVDPAGVRDKDGVSAALLVAELAATLKARGPHPHRPARRPGPRARPARHRPALGPGRRPLADPGRDGPAARARRRQRSAAGRSSPRRTSPPAARTCRRPTACVTGWPTAGRGRRAALRHRAEAQVLPRGRRPGAVRRRRRPGDGAPATWRRSGQTCPRRSPSADQLDESGQDLIRRRHGDDLVADPASPLAQLHALQDLRTAAPTACADDIVRVQGKAGRRAHESGGVAELVGGLRQAELRQPECRRRQQGARPAVGHARRHSAAARPPAEPAATPGPRRAAVPTQPGRRRARRSPAAGHRAPPACAGAQS